MPTLYCQGRLLKIDKDEIHTAFSGKFLRPSIWFFGNNPYFNILILHDVLFRSF